MGISILSCNQNKQAQEVKVQASAAEHKQMPVWSAAIPDAGYIKGSETNNDGMVTNVSKPTITIYSPKENNTGVAVVVFPGGGYRALAINLEGSEICEWLTSIGVTGILLKYRVPDSGPHWDPACNCHKEALKPLALEDAQRTMGLVRFHAKEWNIDPEKLVSLDFRQVVI